MYRKLGRSLFTATLAATLLLTNTTLLAIGGIGFHSGAAPMHRGAYYHDSKRDYGTRYFNNYQHNYYLNSFDDFYSYYNYTPGFGEYTTSSGSADD